MARPDWLHVQAPTHAIGPERTDLGEGEREAIRLAVEMSADALLVDDRDARHEAERLGVPALGTLRVLADGSQHGFADLAVAFARLRQTNFRASNQLLQQLFDDATAAANRNDKPTLRHVIVWERWPSSSLPSVPSALRGLDLRRPLSSSGICRAPAADTSTVTEEPSAARVKFRSSRSARAWVKSGAEANYGLAGIEKSLAFIGSRQRGAQYVPAEADPKRNQGEVSQALFHLTERSCSRAAFCGSHSGQN